MGSSPDTALLEDNLEFIENEIDNDENDVDQLDEISEKSKLLKLVKDCGLKKKQAYKFLSSVELDFIRKESERLELSSLFMNYCKYGEGSWLNPMPYILMIDESLMKFACATSSRSDIMQPIIKLLNYLAVNDINPTSFLKYVISPRLLNDNNWRKWNENHYESFKIIANVLIEMNGISPFVSEKINNAGNNLSKGIVLVKYVGSPLSMFSENELGNKILINRYQQAWHKISLDSSFSILFIKTNILHFFYALCGKLTLQHLTLIIEQIPEIENGFRENSENFKGLDLSKINMNLYDYDIGKSINSRINKGFKIADYVHEIKSYLKIITALLSTNSGIFLCGFFANKLFHFKDPAIAEAIANLISILDDDGGKRVYIWHTKKMLLKNKDELSSYIQYVEDNNGCDPNYPHADNVFQPIEQENAFYSIINVANKLEISVKELEIQYLKRTNVKFKTVQDDDIPIPLNFNVDKYIYKDLINSYMKKHPSSKEIIGKYHEEFISGNDTSWDKNWMKEIDSLGISLHGPLLRMAIRGIGNYFSDQKSSSFTNLYDQYNVINDVKNIPVHHKFVMPVMDNTNQATIARDEIKKRINLKLVSSVWQMLTTEEPFSPNLIQSRINALSMALNDPLQKLMQKLEILNKAVMEETDKDSILKEKKEIEKLNEKISKIKTKKTNFENILNLFPYLNDYQKITVGIITAGHIGNTGDELTNIVSSQLLQNYAKKKEISTRLEFLKSDIAIEMITFKQFTYIMNTLEVLINLAVSDSELQNIVLSDNETNRQLRGAMVPFLLTRNKVFSIDHQDAALKKMYSFGKISTERALWQDIIESVKNDDSKYFHHYHLNTSRTIMDAYYGDMGGICLARETSSIKNLRMFNIRLISEKDKEVVGMAILHASNRGLASYKPNCGVFLHVFAINPLRSILTSMSTKQQLLMYLNYRKLFETFSIRTKKIIVLSGVVDQYIISNDWSFREIIVNYELKNHAKKVNDAYGLSIIYKEDEFAQALVIIDPSRPETFRADEAIKIITSKEN